MPTLHLKTNEMVMTKILTFLDSLSRRGDEILDDKICAFPFIYCILTFSGDIIDIMPVNK